MRAVTCCKNRDADSASRQRAGSRTVSPEAAAMGIRVSFTGVRNADPGSLDCKLALDVLRGCATFLADTERRQCVWCAVLAGVAGSPSSIGSGPGGRPGIGSVAPLGCTQTKAPLGG